MDNLWAINDKFVEICVAKRSVYFRRTHVKVQALDMHPWNYSLKLIKLKQVFAMVHQAEASRRTHVNNKRTRSTSVHR